MIKLPTAIITLFRRTFGPPEYRLLDVRECSTISFTSAQAAADYVSEHYAGETVQWNLA